MASFAASSMEPTSATKTSVYLPALYLHYCNIVQSVSSNLKEATLLELYGIFKHVSTPDILVEGSENYIGERPGFFNMAARRKYDAVVEEGKRGGVEAEEDRMLRYVKVVESAAGDVDKYTYGEDGGGEVLVETFTRPREMKLKMLITFPLPADGEVKAFSMSVKVSRPQEMVDEDLASYGETHGDGGGFEEGADDAVLRKRLADYVRDGDAAGVSTFPPAFFVPPKREEGDDGDDEDATSLLHEACNLGGDDGVKVVMAVIEKLKQAETQLEGGFEGHINSGEITPMVTAAVAGNVGTVMILKQEGAEVDMEDMEDFEVCEEVMSVLR